MNRVHDKPLVSAVVLAAGSSRRMGTPKQLLRLSERTVLDHTLNHVRASSVVEIIVVLGFASAEIQREVSMRGVKVVLNPAYHDGMSSSLRLGLGALDPKAQAALIILADQPCVRPVTLDSVIEHYRISRSQIVIPTYRGFRGNPVLLDRSVFPEIMEIRGDVGCRAIFGGHAENIIKLPVNDVGILLDVDTREDLNRLAASCEQPGSEAALPPVAELESRTTEADNRVSYQPELVVVGRDGVAVALLKLGRMLHFITTVVDPLLSLKELPDADRVLHRLDLSLLTGGREQYVLVASRGQYDEDAVDQALQSEAAYVGLLANRKRAKELTTSLRRKGIPAEKLERLRASAGLDIGAESPEEIALSIMAEIVAVRASSS